MVSPAWRIAAALIFTAAVSMAGQRASLAAGAAIAMILVAAAGLAIRLVLRRLAAVAGLLALVWITLPLTVKGPALVHIGPFAFSRGGAALSLAITVKSLVMTAAFLTLVAAMPAHLIGHGLERLRFPAKLVHLLLLAYRYIAVFEQEYQRLWRAARVRGFRPTTSLHAYRTYAYFVGMLFVRAWSRAERVHKAMRCRGFSGRFYCLQRFDGGWPDRVFAAAMIGAAVLVLALDNSTP
jgi:cobalt/nickel transport system permease protein